MSWMEKLYETYLAAQQLDLPADQALMPISHTPQNAHINIVIDGDGNFKRASVLEKTQIMLPATESSASRSSGEAPHALDDKLQYVAKDYADYGGQKKAYFGSYSAQLQAWCNSAHAHKKVQAVCRYVQKGTVIADLLAQHIVFVDADNRLLDQWPGGGDTQPPLFRVLPKDKGKLDQGSALVCWTVETATDEVADTWKDPSIQASWIAFDTADGGDSGWCLVTGTQQTLACNHPAKLRHSGDKAKLISSNDTGGYTYRGKFIDTNQACSIGFDTTQKAHNALRWLISRQGSRNGDQVYVAWALSGADIPKPLADAWELFMSDDEFELERADTNESPDTAPVTQDHGRDLGEAYARQLKKYMAGYAAKLGQNEQIIIMGLDSATPGRMGIIYYRELFAHDFLDRLKAWHEEFAWWQRHTKELPNPSGKKSKIKVIWPVSSPVPLDIAKAAYGDNVDDNLKKKTIERLLPCIIDGQNLPPDLLYACVRRATNRVGYASDKQWLWEKNLGIACALYKGYHHRHSDSKKRRDYIMALEENNTSRDYLYGRLLAVAERIEDIALSVSGENRPTTAARLMQRFADRPFETWRTIELALQPYMQRLRVSRGGFLANRLKEIDSINAMFDPEDFINPRPLSGEFLLGYHCQRQYFKNKPETSDPNSNEPSGEQE